MRNIKLTIEYDGTNYCGWQRQKNGVSIEENIELAISKIINENVKIIGSSRTDAGVHAKGQTANFFTETSIPASRLSSAINSKLPRDISILESEEVPEDFHSRYSSKGKKYSYTILNRKAPIAYMGNYMSHYAYMLDFDKMLEVSKGLLGTHDFTSFKSTGSSVKTSIRTINHISLEKHEDIIKLEVEGDGFLYNMVRIIAGTLVDIGRGRIHPEKLQEIILSKDRRMAGHTAPAAGLCLEKVYYAIDTPGRLY